jgi:hypothetical protein
MTVQNTEFDDFGQKPQTVYYEQDTSVSGTSDVINFDFNLKPGYYTFSSFGGGTRMFFNANWSTGTSMDTGSIFRATSSTLATAYLPLSNSWGVVAGTFNNPSSPAGLIHSYFAQGVYVICARNGGMYVSSNNGTTWTSYNSTFGQPDGHALAYVDGLYVNASSSANRISTTTTPANPASWTTRTNYGLNAINFWSAVNPRLAGTVAYSAFATSNDGATWTTRPRPTSNNRNLKQAGAYNYMFADPGSLYYSNNNTTWTQASIPSTPQGVMTGITSGNGVYIATGQYWATGSWQNNGVYYSTNGTTFTTAALAGGASGLKLGQGEYCWPLEFSTSGGRFVVFTTSQSFSSADGLNWVKHSTSSNIPDVSNIGWFNSNSAANIASFVGSDGKIIYTVSSGQTGITYRSFSNSGTMVWNSSQSLARGSITYWGDVDTSKFAGKAMF